MDIKNGSNFRYDRYSQYNRLGSNKYDYARYGILNRCLPKIFFKGNPILASFIQAIDIRIVMLLQYVDRLKHFKHISMY